MYSPRWSMSLPFRLWTMENEPPTRAWISTRTTSPVRDRTSSGPCRGRARRRRHAPAARRNDARRRPWHEAECSSGHLSCQRASRRRRAALLPAERAPRGRPRAGPRARVLGRGSRPAGRRSLHALMAAPQVALGALASLLRGLAAARRLQFDARPAGLREPIAIACWWSERRACPRARARFLTDECTGLSGRRLSLTLGLAGLLDGLSFRHGFLLGAHVRRHHSRSRKFHTVSRLARGGPEH